VNGKFERSGVKPLPFVPTETPPAGGNAFKWEDFERQVADFAAKEAQPPMECSHKLIAQPRLHG
jgi:hypothetical protein